MFENLYKGKRFFGFFIVLTILLLNGLSLIMDIQRITTFIILPLLFLIGLFSNLKFLEITPIEYFFLVLIFFSGIISSSFGVNLETFYRDLSMSIGVLVSAFIPLIVNYKRDYYKYFFSAYYLSFFILIFYMYTSGNLEPGIEDYTNRSRFLFNANMYSYLAFFGNISLFYLHQKYLNKLTTYILIGFGILSLYISFITASRSGFVFGLLINFIYWYWIFNSKHKNTSFKAVLILISILVYFKISEMYQSSYLGKRIEYSVEHGDSRGGLAREAFDIFRKHPFFGVGPGQFIHYSESGSYSHNSFTEISATQGLIGLILLLILFFFPLHEAIKFYRLDSLQNTYWKINILFYTSFIFFNLFYPFYKYTYSMMFFFLIISFQKNLIKNYNVYLNS